MNAQVAEGEDDLRVDHSVITEVEHPESEFITVRVGPVDKPFFW